MRHVWISSLVVRAFNTARVLRSVNSGWCHMLRSGQPRRQKGKSARSRRVSRRDPRHAALSSNIHWNKVCFSSKQGNYFIKLNSRKVSFRGMICSKKGSLHFLIRLPLMQKNGGALYFHLIILPNDIFSSTRCIRNCFTFTRSQFYFKGLHFSSNMVIVLTTTANPRKLVTC